MQRHFCQVLLLCLLGSSHTALAQQLAPTSCHWASAREAQILPIYCQDLCAKRNHRRWRQTFGKSHSALGHYCKGLVSLNKARFSADRKERRGYAQQAFGAFHSITGGVEATNWALLPKLYVDRGKALEMLGRDHEAASEYRKAITKKPNYVNAYVALSNYFKRKNDIEAANEVLKEGLEHTPKSKTLTRMLHE